MAVTQLYTAVANDVITSARWNNEFGNIYNNGTAVAFPLTAAVSFAGFTITWDAAAATTMISSASQGIQYIPGAKSGTPSATGGIWNTVANTYTDNATAGAGTAATWTGTSLQRPTLAATNAGVTTTNAATLYIINSPANGTNETITNPYSIWVDDGNVRFDGQIHGLGGPVVNELRLTLTTVLPVTTADVVGAGTLFWTPYTGTHVALYDGTIWKIFSTTEVSLALTLTNGRAYDIFGIITAGAPALESLIWTNDSTRATALAYQNGVLVKSGDATRRYLGSIYASGANVTEDSIAKRYLSNYYNRVPRQMIVTESTDSWTYTTATFRQARATTTNQLDAIIGVAQDAVQIKVQVVTSNTVGTNAAVGIGIDSTTVNSANLFGGQTFTVSHHLNACYNGIPAAGRHTFPWLEYSVAAGVTTWYGDAGVTYLQSGISGIVQG